MLRADAGARWWSIRESSCRMSFTNSSRFSTGLTQDCLRLALPGRSGGTASSCSGKRLVHQCEMTQVQAAFSGLAWSAHKEPGAAGSGYRSSTVDEELR